MELTSSKNNDLVAKNEMMKLAAKEFFDTIEKFSNMLREDVQKLSKEEEALAKEIIDGLNKQLEFIEICKLEKDVSIEMKEKIYDDFNNTASKLADYQIVVYKAKNREKTIKQILLGILGVVSVVGVRDVAIALIKKGKV